MPKPRASPTAGGDSPSSARRHRHEQRSPAEPRPPRPDRCSTPAHRRARPTAESGRDRRQAACPLSPPGRTSGPGPVAPTRHELREPRQHLIHPALHQPEHPEPNDAEGAKTRPANRLTRPVHLGNRQTSPAHRPASASLRLSCGVRSHSPRPAQAGPAATPQPKMRATLKRAPPHAHPRTHLRASLGPRRRGQSQVPRSETRLLRRAEPWRKLPRCPSDPSDRVCPDGQEAMLRDPAQETDTSAILDRADELNSPVLRFPFGVHAGRTGRAVRDPRRGTMRYWDSTRWGTLPVNPRQVGLNASPGVDRPWGLCRYTLAHERSFGKR